MTERRNDGGEARRTGGDPLRSGRGGRGGRGGDVAIRAPGPDDAAAVLRLHAASRRHFGPWMTPMRSAADFAGWLGRCERDDYAGHLAVLVGDGTVVGAANLSQIFRGALCSAYLGYWIGAAHAGRGFMTEALGLVLDRAFGPLGLHRVEANIQPDNAGSIALVRRLGFRQEGFSPRYLKIGGRWRDHERWAILREEWVGAARGAARLPAKVPRK